MWPNMTHGLMAVHHQTTLVKGMSDERQSQPTFVGVVELPDKIGEP